MTDEKNNRKRAQQPLRNLSRRDFAALSSAAVLAGLVPSAQGNQLSVIETDVEVTTPDGTCDAAFFHPKDGAHAGVLIWPDSLGLRPALRELGRRTAAAGYSVLVPNHLYRSAKAPVFGESFNMDNPPIARCTSGSWSPFSRPARRSETRWLTSRSWTRNPG